MCSFGWLLGGQLGDSLYYVIAISLFGVFVMCGRFFFTSFIFWLLPVSSIYSLGKLWMQREGYREQTQH